LPYAALASVLSSVAAYLETLPAGADSYPECSTKASLLRNAVESRPLGPAVPLPPALRALVDHPPPVTAWVPEVLFNALMLAIREVHFDPSDVEGFLAWVYEQNRKILSTPLYRVLFFVVSPERLLVGMEKRWSSFRRGTEARLVRLGDRDVEIHVTSPPNLYAPQTVQGMAAALRATIDCAGAKRAAVEGTVKSSTEVVYRLRWS
jgi:uncharacterized protein (TIGR02265 family)